MNKILKRIASLTLGLSLLGGLGVALASNKQSNASEVDAASGSITFSSGTYSSETITWTASGKLTIKQERNGSSNTAPNSSYVSNPRWYKGNKITFTPASGVTITSLTLTANTNDYATALKNSTWSTSSATSNSTTVSWTGSASSAFTVVMGGQCRLSTSMTFTYTSSDAPSGHEGTSTDPFTVEEGIEKCKEIGTTAAGPWVVKGVISKKTTWDSNYTNVTYWISDDGTGGDDVTKTIQCYRGKYLNGANVTASNEGEFSLGKIVTVTGNLVNYNGKTPEFAAGNYPLSIEAPAQQVFTVTSNIEHTSLNVSEVFEGETLTVNIIPEIGYMLPSSLTSVKAGGVDVAYTYENGVLTIENVQGNIVITGSVTSCNPIRSLYDWPNNTTGVNFYAYYVGFLDGSGPVVMNGEYGVLLFKSDQDVSNWTEKQTILHIKSGKTSWYNGLLEVASYSVEVVESAENVSAPVVYAAQGNETKEYASRLTTVSGVPTVTKGDVSQDAGTADITLSFAVGQNTVTVFYKKAVQTADADTYAAVKAAVTNSTSITVKGFTGWYNGFQVQMNGYVEEVASYTAEMFGQDLLDQTDDVCENYNGTDNNHDALVSIWSDLASNDKYPSLPAEQKTLLANASRNESGTVIERAMARYDYLTGKYNLSNFINGRTPVSFQQSRVSELTYEHNTSSIIVIVITVMSASSMALLIVMKRRRTNVK